MFYDISSIQVLAQLISVPQRKSKKRKTDGQEVPAAHRPFFLVPSSTSLHNEVHTHTQQQQQRKVESLFRSSHPTLPSCFCLCDFVTLLRSWHGDTSANHILEHTCPLSTVFSHTPPLCEINVRSSEPFYQKSRRVEVQEGQEFVKHNKSSHTSYQMSNSDRKPCASALSSCHDPQPRIISRGRKGILWGKTTSCRTEMYKYTRPIFFLFFCTRTPVYHHIHHTFMAVVSRLRSALTAVTALLKALFATYPTTPQSLAKPRSIFWVIFTFWIAKGIKKVIPGQ